MTENNRQPIHCAVCGTELAAHVQIRSGERTAYGGLHLAPGMIAVRGKKRTYGPSPARKRGNRSSDLLMVKKPGPVTLYCRRAGCPGVQETVVASATVL